MKYVPWTLAIAFTLYAGDANSQTFTTVLSFTGTGGSASGSEPCGSLTVSGETLYGMTPYGGINGDGNIFSVGTSGTNYQNLVSFTGASGAMSGKSPYGNLSLNGTTLYGMTAGSGPYPGNVFSVGTGGGNYQNLVSFTGANGAYPGGSLTLSGTTLYGMTSGGGGPYRAGNVFSVGTGGTNYQNLLSFTGYGYSAANGASPGGNLTLCGTTLYGMTLNGGINGDGNVFSVGSNGMNYQNLLSFTGNDGAALGAYPGGSLILSGTTLYGMTSGDNDGGVFSVGIDGTDFQNLVSFTGIGGVASGATPRGSLILNGTALYGTTNYGGTYGDGDVFSVGTDGSNFEDLYDFTGGTDGAFPQGDLTLSGSTLYGTASGAGAYGNGTVFALTLPTPSPEPGTLSLISVVALMIVSNHCLRMRFLLGSKP